MPSVDNIKLAVVTCGLSEVHMYYKLQTVGGIQAWEGVTIGDAVAE